MDIRTYLSEEARRMQAESLQALPAPADWPQARKEWLAQYYAMMGVTSHMALTERPPLNVCITKETQRDGYRILNLYYESLPGLYVTGNLYLPTNTENPIPGVLYVCGHAQKQKEHYQAHPRKFAQLGMACLLVETIQLGEDRREPSRHRPSRLVQLVQPGLHARGCGALERRARPRPAGSACRKSTARGWGHRHLRWRRRELVGCCRRRTREGGSAGLRYRHLRLARVRKAPWTATATACSS